MKRPRVTWIEALVIIGIVALVISIINASLDRLRETTGRSRCPSNLKQIGQAILLYSNERGGAMPDSLATILRTQDLVPEVFVCPRDDARIAKDVASFRGDERDCSYIYVGDGVPYSAFAEFDDVVVAFDRPDTHEGDGVNVLYGDGHVEFQAFTPRGTRPAWWRDLEAEIARGDRPVRDRRASAAPATRPQSLDAR